MLLQSVLNVVKKVTGITPDGTRIPSYFGDEQNRSVMKLCFRPALLVSFLRFGSCQFLLFRVLAYDSHVI